MGDERTLGDLERTGEMSRELIAHCEENWGAGWRDVTLKEDSDARAVRTAELDQGIAEDEQVIAVAKQIIAEHEARLREIEGDEPPSTSH